MRMMRWISCVVVVTASWIISLSAAIPAGAQESAAECASAFWLAPAAATPAAEEANAAENGAGEAAPLWLTTALTDACSGETFTLADFAGKTVFIDAMATWCPSCREQLERNTEAARLLSDEQRHDVVMVVLSIETDLPREALAEYAAANDFPFMFAVMPVAMLRAMVDDLGREIAVPGATPHLIVAPDGTIGELRTGAMSPQNLLALIAEAAEAAGS